MGTFKTIFSDDEKHFSSYLLDHKKWTITQLKSCSPANNK